MFKDGKRDFPKSQGGGTAFGQVVQFLGSGVVAGGTNMCHPGDHAIVQNRGQTQALGIIQQLFAECTQCAGPCSGLWE